MRKIDQSIIQTSLREAITNKLILRLACGIWIALSCSETLFKLPAFLLTAPITRTTKSLDTFQRIGWHSDRCFSFSICLEADPELEFSCHYFDDLSLYAMTEAPAEGKKELQAVRNVIVDKVRLASTLLVVVYHVIQTYDFGTAYHLKAPKSDRSLFLSHMTLFIKVWHMPLFFILAGWSLQTSLAKRLAFFLLIYITQRDTESTKRYSHIKPTLTKLADLCSQICNHVDMISIAKDSSKLQTAVTTFHQRVSAIQAESALRSSKPSMQQYSALHCPRSLFLVWPRSLNAQNTI